MTIDHIRTCLVQFSKKTRCSPPPFPIYRSVIYLGIVTREAEFGAPRIFSLREREVLNKAKQIAMPKVKRELKTRSEISIWKTTDKNK